MGASRNFAAGNSEYFDCGDISAVDSVAQVTMCAWMYRTSTANYVLMGKGSTATSRNSVWWWSDGNVYLEVYNGGTTYATFAANLTGWHHIAMVFDGSQGTGTDRYRGYLDGVEQSLTFTGTPPTTTPAEGAFTLGRVGTITSFYTTGNMADAMLFSDALTTEQILEAMWRPAQFAPPSREGYWMLREESGDEPDYSVNSNTGTDTNTCPTSELGPPVSIGRAPTLGYKAAAAAGGTILPQFYYHQYAGGLS